jgi:O-antigen/teichoic acid export membrane protein
MMQRSYKDVVAYFAAIAVGQLISFGLFPVITRALSPTQYGDYSLALTLANLAGVIGSSWIRNLAMRLYFDARSEGRTRVFASTVAILQAGSLILAYGAVATVAERLVGVSLPVLLHATALFSILLGDLYALLLLLLRAEQASWLCVVAELMNAGLRFVGTAGGLLLGFRSPVLLFVAASTALVVPALVAVRRVRHYLTGPRQLDTTVLMEILRLGPVAIPFTLGVWGLALVDRLVLERYGSRELVGIYSAAYALADRLMGALIMALYLVAWPKILHRWEAEGEAGAVQATRTGFQLYFWITVGPLLFLIRFDHLVSTWLLGSQYPIQPQLIPLIAVGVWLYGAASYLNRPLELQKRYSLLSGITLGAAGLNLILNLILVPAYGIVGAAMATLAAYAFVTLAFFLSVHRQARVPFGDLTCSLLLAVTAWGTSNLVVDPWASAGVFIMVYSLGAAARAYHLRKIVGAW